MKKKMLAMIGVGKYVVCFWRKQLRKQCGGTSVPDYC